MLYMKLYCKIATNPFHIHIRIKLKSLFSVFEKGIRIYGGMSNYGYKNDLTLIRKHNRR